MKNKIKIKTYLVEDPAYILIRNGENPAPAFAELVQER
jgi:hypothetical protein